MQATQSKWFPYSSILISAEMGFSARMALHVAQKTMINCMEILPPASRHFFIFICFFWTLCANITAIGPFYLQGD